MASVAQSRGTGVLRRPGRTRQPLGLLLLAAVGSAFIVLPLLSLLQRAPWADLATGLLAPDVLEALRLSLVCSVSATVLSVLLGVPLAWAQVRLSFPGKRLLAAFTTLPVVLPPVVGGVALLMVFGREGLLGGLLYDVLGVRLAFSTTGAVLAATFVAMPFLVLTVSGALQADDGRLEDAARTLGASEWSVFWRVTLPALRPSLVAGSVLCWARALGEFGATITFAGNIPGSTQTMPLAVYLALETNVEGAITLSLILLAVSVTVLFSMRRQWFGAL